LIDAGDILGIEMLDSIVFDKGGKFYSIKDNN
jgi:hypothetical protein